MFSFYYRDDALNHLENIPHYNVSKEQIEFLLTPEKYKETLLTKIKEAQERIFLVALYLENDEAGLEILEALYQAKINNPQLTINICLDWHRAQRGRIGEGVSMLTNADWYVSLRKKYHPVEISYYGVPINTREALGVLHFKGAVIDNEVILSGASINNVYLKQTEKYRLDRYHVILNKGLSDSFVQYITQHLIEQEGVFRLDFEDRPKTNTIKKTIKMYRKHLRNSSFKFMESEDTVLDKEPKESIQIRPIVGVGPKNPFNQVIVALMTLTQKRMIICTPYFNLPPKLLKLIKKKLSQGVHIDIIVGDKTANDFYIPLSEPFRAIGGLPYLYELNLIRFMKKNQKYCDKDQLTINLWKDLDNTYHLKGLWIDDEWMLLTGNNLNPRAWRLDLENGVLIKDSGLLLKNEKELELEFIKKNTHQITHFTQLDSIEDYPLKVRKLIRRVKRLRLDKIINKML